MDKRICAAVEATEAVGDDMEQSVRELEREAEVMEKWVARKVRRACMIFRLNTASFGSPDEQAVRELLADNEAAQATIALERAALLKANAELAKRDSEWMDSAGKFRMALHEHGLHGHYNLFQEWEWPAALASTAPVAAQKEGEQ